MVLLLVAEHLGKLHRYEALLVYLLAFGPFLLLAVTIRIARKRLAHEDSAHEDSAGEEQTEEAGPEAATKPAD